MAGTLFSSFNTLANIYAVNFENLKYVCSARCKQIFKILDVKYEIFHIYSCLEFISRFVFFRLLQMVLILSNRHSSFGKSSTLFPWYALTNFFGFVPFKLIYINAFKCGYSFVHAAQSHLDGEDRRT
jgi:hypothetical protein